MEGSGPAGGDGTPHSAMNPVDPVDSSDRPAEPNFAAGPRSSVASRSGWRRAGDVWGLLARWILGALFLFMGGSKAADPVGFLKLVREYDVLPSPYLLNFVAATVPWFEVMCGLLLILGIAVRGTAVLLAGLLVSFTALIWWRALGLQEAGHLPFCSIRFDCGCGTGPVLVCRKLAENVGLVALALSIVGRRRHRLSLWAWREDLR